MKKILAVGLLVCFISGFSLADTFGTGVNQFEIDFVAITGDASSANGTNISQYSSEETRYKTFEDTGYDYRIGTYEITNDQWNKFKAAYGTMTGSHPEVYDQDSRFTGNNIPSNNVSWLEAAQFVNWLNTSSGHQAAYKFDGTPGTSDYRFSIWNSTEAWGGTNLYRHKDAFYFLPTEDEWVKAAYWNGNTLQEYSTIDGLLPTQNGWNFYDDGYATGQFSPWDVGSGSEELNGTYDMMGNLWEWVENDDRGRYSTLFGRVQRGGAFYSSFSPESLGLGLFYRSVGPTTGDFAENAGWGFRVASVPEPTTLLVLGIGAVLIRKRK
jgi:formylglycine-generating enzyme required for sulfatase activity